MRSGCRPIDLARWIDASACRICRSRQRLALLVSPLPQLDRVLIVESGVLHLALALVVATDVGEEAALQFQGHVLGQQERLLNQDLSLIEVALDCEPARVLITEEEKLLSRGLVNIVHLEHIGLLAVVLIGDAIVGYQLVQVGHQERLYLNFASLLLEVSGNLDEMIDGADALRLQRSRMVLQSCLLCLEKL